MRIAALFAFLTPLIPHIQAKDYEHVGPYGYTNGKNEARTWIDPQFTIPRGAHVQKIFCTYGWRLDYLAVYYDSYMDWGKQHIRGLEYGNLQHGKKSASRHLTEVDRIKNIAPYVCDSGKTNGWICGLLIEFEFEEPLRCGTVTETSFAHLPKSISPEHSWHFNNREFHSFFVEQRGTDITRLGWTLKG